MRITIIIADKAVYKNGVCYNKLDLSSAPSNVHALQWFTTSGWIEFNNGTRNQQITQLPSWANQCVAKWDAADYLEKNPPPPSNEQLIANCKETARAWLLLTDYATLPDVINRLVNHADFVAFRATVRELYINPVANPVWPTLPDAQWKP